ncbi:MAG: polysaccharide pyruvyl transferase family protein [Gammaproteobacteria bacterium]|nr:polysaccharide pyruvyl transferase family protein [Gammaproteobacteria bacterium]
MSISIVKQVLNSLPKDEVIFYRANPGNAGDSLIASGAFKLFKESGLNIKILDPSNFDAAGKIVIYAGGGNLVGIYPETRDFFFQHHKSAKQLILLPHTIAKNEDLLKELGSNVTLFARENVSYEYIKTYASKANFFLDHDLALQLDPDIILNSPRISFPSALYFKIIYKLRKDPRATHIPSIHKMLNNTLFEINSYLTGNKENANFFRNDVESLSGNIPEKNADLSKIYEYGTKNEYLTQYTTSRLMKYINQFAKVRTDRLHVCIAAALLNKQVEFYPNSYFKCRAVYEYSLKDRFKNIKWMGEVG